MASTSTTPRWTHPRSRGEHRTHPPSTASRGDSPPLARGARRRRRPTTADGGLTPARAGSTTVVTSSPPEYRTHPRSRGEHDTRKGSPTCIPDSPPLARGARHRRVRPQLLAGLTPARAGSTSRHRHRPASTGTHPRSRGEHLQIHAQPGPRQDSPPLARGARGFAELSPRLGGLTPARAGSTSPHRSCCDPARTHPRSRGEHITAAAQAVLARDSPPLARGAPFVTC